MESSTEINGNDCEINNSNETDGEVMENGEIVEREDTAQVPQINILHEDVKKYIEKYVEKLGYSNVIVDVEIGSNLGDNFMGFIGKLTVTGVDRNDEIKTFYWIIKTAPDIESYRTVINVSVVYQRELYLYRDVFQIFKDFQRERRILEPFDHHPEFVLAYEEYMKESLVMKDMKRLGYVMRPKQQTLDLNHVKLVMKAYAKFHAMSYALKHQNPDLFETMVKTLQDIGEETIFTENGIKSQAPLVEMMIAALDPVKDAKIRTVFKKFLDNYSEIILKSLGDTNERSVIGHGDSWVNNMLWKYDEKNPNIPKKVCILDWQLARYASPVCDLSYFLFTCTSKEFRDKHYDNMIKLYYYTLCGHVAELGTDPQKYLTFEALQEELKKHSLIGLFMSCMVLFLITREADEIPEWRSNDVQNQEEIEEQWFKSSKNINVYNERVRAVVTDFYEKGYLDQFM